jgi:hypothetical protein
VLTTEVVEDIAPVGGGVVWLTTNHGRLFRNEHDGEHWTELTVESG